MKLWVYFADFLIVIYLFLTYAGLFGFTKMTLNDGSMIPTYKEGDIVYSLHSDYEELQENDIILYKVEKTTLCRRIHGFEDNGIITKGDAIPTEDSFMADYETYIGKVVFHIPHGKLYRSITDAIWYKLLVGCMIVLTFII